VVFSQSVAGRLATDELYRWGFGGRIMRHFECGKKAMDKQQMKVALDVLSAVCFRRKPSESDILLLRSWATAGEKGVAVDELARHIIIEQLSRQQTQAWSFATSEDGTSARLDRSIP